MKTIGRRDFLRLGIGLSAIPISKIIGQSNGFDVLKMTQQPAGTTTYGIVGQWNDIANKYHLYSGQYPPILKDGNTSTHYDFGNNNVILRAGIICDGNGNEKACYWGELGEGRVREYLKEGCGYEKKGM